MGVRIRGIPVSNEEAAELARRVRAYGDPIGIGVAERLERGLLMGTAVVGTSPPEARATLNVIEQFIPRGLREVRDDLSGYLSAPDMAA